MNATEFAEKYWDYYLKLESDFINTQRYVTIDNDNYFAFSIEYAKQYETICSEIGYVCKLYCNHLCNPNSASKSLEYKNVILTNRADIKLRIVRVNNLSTIILKPWNLNGDVKDPLNGNNAKIIFPWWNTYNKVKQNRITFDTNGKGFFKNANLINTLNALAGLFLLEMYFYKDLVETDGIHKITIPNRASNLFRIDDWEEHLKMVEDGLVLAEL